MTDTTEMMTVGGVRLTADLRSRLTYAMGAETISSLETALTAAEDAVGEVAAWLRDQAPLHPEATTTLLEMAARLDARRL
jgi:hypothetical protein